MAFKKVKTNKQFADLKGVLTQSKQTDPALAQTVSVLIDRLTKFQSETNEAIAASASGIGAGETPSGGGGGGGGGTGLTLADLTQSFLTRNIETADLVNSLQLIAGLNITFDTSVANQLKINATAGGGAAATHYDTPLTDGDPDETNLIFASGDCIIVQVPI